MELDHLSTRISLSVNRLVEQFVIYVMNCGLALCVLSGLYKFPF